MKKNRKEYYIIKNKALAIAISYVINERFQIYDDRIVEGKKIYTFELTDKFIKGFSEIQELKRCFN